jgi:hypothetical protein
MAPQEKGLLETRPTENGGVTVDEGRIPVEEKLVGFGGDPFVAVAVRDMLPSERNTWLRMYYAPEYKRELQRLRDWAVEPPRRGGRMTRYRKGKRLVAGGCIMCDRPWEGDVRERMHAVL